jgi:hypothetical protein
VCHWLGQCIPDDERLNGAPIENQVNAALAKPVAHGPKRNQTPNDCRNTAGATSPKQNALPVSILWNTISAGLKSIGSIL